MGQETDSQREGRVCNPHNLSICPYDLSRYLMTISNTRVGLTAKGRRTLFSKVTFGAHGSWCVAVDQLGTVYTFDLARNKSAIIIQRSCDCHVTFLDTR